MQNGAGDEMDLRCRASVLGVCLWLCACGRPAAEPPPAASQPTEGAELPPAEDSVQVEGLKGTLSSTEVQDALEPRMLKFAVCPGRSSDLEFIAGEMAFHFTVDADGRVQQVYATRSTLGDRETEKCMLEAARSVKFPRPQGGAEADFDWSLEIPPDPEVRAPVVWPADQAAGPLEESAPALLESCGGGPYTVTAYVDTDGTVMAAGAVSGAAEDAEALDCIAAGVSDWTFPTPGSYPAKLTFSLQ